MSSLVPLLTALSLFIIAYQFALFIVVKVGMKLMTNRVRDEVDLQCMVCVGGSTHVDVVCEAPQGWPCRPGLGPGSL